MGKVRFLDWPWLEMNLFETSGWASNFYYIIDRIIVDRKLTIFFMFSNMVDKLETIPNSPSVQKV